MSDDVIVIDDDVVINTAALTEDTEEDDDSVAPPWPAPAPVSGQKRSRAAYLELLNEAKESTHDAKKPTHPGPGATPDQIRKYNEDLQAYYGEREFARQCEALQFSTLQQDHAARQMRLRQETQLEELGAIADFESFKPSLLLKSGKLAEFINWLDAQTRLSELYKEHSVLLMRKSAKDSWRLRLKAVSKDADCIMVTDVSPDALFERPELARDAKTRLHTPLTETSAAPPSLDTFFKAIPSKSKSKAAQLTAVRIPPPVLRVGDRIVALGRCDLRSFARPSEKGGSAALDTAIAQFNTPALDMLVRVRSTTAAPDARDIECRRPAWSFAYNRFILRRLVVRLLGQEKVALKWFAQARQYFDRLQKLIDEAIEADVSAGPADDSFEAAERFRTAPTAAVASDERKLITLLSAECERLREGLTRLPTRSGIAPIPDILLEGYVAPATTSTDDDDNIEFLETEERKTERVAFVT